MEWILSAIITAMPVIIGPTINVAILSNPKVREVFKTPIDFGKNFIDNRRIFGDNKTWKGLFLSILICICTASIWGIICKYIPAIGNRNWFYINYENTILYNILIGALFGLTYSLFELPNSFLKRRCNIEPGKSSKVNGKKRIIFTIIDHFDSGFGTMLVVCYFGNLTALEYVNTLFLSAFVHYTIVKILYNLKLKQAM